MLERTTPSLLPNAVFVTWSRQCTRSSNQARHLGAELVIVRSGSAVPGPIGTILRYFASFSATILQLRKRKPEVVLTENQPIFLVLAVWIYAATARIPFIIDSHSGAFNNPKWRWALPIYRVLARRALVNINTNEAHRTIVESWGGRSVIVADIPIFVDSIDAPREPVEPYVVAITSFGFDEPIAEILEAARLSPETQFLLTGNELKLSKQLREQAPENVRFTGFVPYAQYLGFISRSLGVLVLTTRDNTMQRGAYEALSLAIPIITSDFPILRESFSAAALYISNTAREIADAVREVRIRNNEIRAAAVRQREVRAKVYEAAISSISDLLLRHKSSHA